MDIKKEYKFALPTSLGLLFGVISGSLVFFVMVGTVVGLVWGYSDHMLGSKKTHKKSSPRKSKASKSKKKKK